MEKKKINKESITLAKTIINLYKELKTEKNKNKINEKINAIKTLNRILHQNLGDIKYAKITAYINKNSGLYK